MSHSDYSDAHDEAKRIRAEKAQDYTLPKAVQIALDVNLKQSASTGVIMALFASGLYSLAGMVAAKSAEANTTSWHALRFFVYSSIVLNLSGAVLSLVITKMCSDLPLSAIQTIVRRKKHDTEPNDEGDHEWILKGSPNIPFAAADSRILEPKILRNHSLLLESFGMTPMYKCIIWINTGVLVVACICTFTAIIFWIFLNETIITAGVTMIVLGPTAILVVGVFITGNAAQGWR